MSTRSQLASSAGKFETLGSNFSQETPQVATGVLILQFPEVFFSYVPLSFLRTEKRLLNCSMDTRSQLASSAGKFETLGSNFSNETRICEAACILILQSLEDFFFYAFMSFPRTEKRLLIVVWALEANWLLAQENLRPRLKF